MITLIVLVLGSTILPTFLKTIRSHSFQCLHTFFFSLHVVHRVKMFKIHHFLKREDQYLTLSRAQSLE